MLRGRVGDTFEITLINDGTIDHGIDFHAGALAPDEPCAHRPRRALRLPVHRHEGRDLDVPLLDHADAAPHRQRHVRRGHHRPARPAARRPRVRPRAVRALPRRPSGEPGDLAKMQAEQPGRGGLQRLRRPVRPPAAGRPRRRAGTDLGARRRPQPATAPSTSSAPSSTPSTVEGELAAAARRPGRRPDPRPRPRPPAVSSSCTSRAAATTRSSATPWSTPSAAPAALFDAGDRHDHRPAPARPVRPPAAASPCARRFLPPQHGAWAMLRLPYLAGRHRRRIPVAAPAAARRLGRRLPTVLLHLAGGQIPPRAAATATNSCSTRTITVAAGSHWSSWPARRCSASPRSTPLLFAVNAVVRQPAPRSRTAQRHRLRRPELPDGLRRRHHRRRTTARGPRGVHAVPAVLRRHRSSTSRR